MQNSLGKRYFRRDASNYRDSNRFMAYQRNVNFFLDCAVSAESIEMDCERRFPMGRDNVRGIRGRTAAGGGDIP